MSSIELHAQVEEVRCTDSTERLYTTPQHGVLF